MIRTSLVIWSYYSIKLWTNIYFPLYLVIKDAQNNSQFNIANPILMFCPKFTASVFFANSCRIMNIGYVRTITATPCSIAIHILQNTCLYLTWNGQWNLYIPFNFHLTRSAFYEYDLKRYENMLCAFLPMN